MSSYQWNILDGVKHQSNKLIVWLAQINVRWIWESSGKRGTRGTVSWYPVKPFSDLSYGPSFMNWRLSFFFSLLHMYIRLSDMDWRLCRQWLSLEYLVSESEDCIRDPYYRDSQSQEVHLHIECHSTKFVWEYPIMSHVLSHL